MAYEYSKEELAVISKVIKQAVKAPSIPSDSNDEYVNVAVDISDEEYVVLASVASRYGLKPMEFMSNVLENLANILMKDKSNNEISN